MINNPYLRDRQIKINDELRILAVERKVAEQKLNALGINANQARKKSSTIPEEKWKEREQLIKELYDVEKKVLALKAEKDATYKKLDAGRSKVIAEIFGEIFSANQRRLIYEEADRRQNGEESIPVGLDFKELERYKNGYYNYRKVAQEQVQKMMEFRVMLTKIIEQGCEKFGDAEFLKLISPLNRLIIPLKDLEKLKREHFL